MIRQRPEAAERSAAPPAATQRQRFPRGRPSVDVTRGADTVDVALIWLAQLRLVRRDEVDLLRVDRARLLDCTLDGTRSARGFSRAEGIRRFDTGGHLDRRQIACARQAGVRTAGDTAGGVFRVRGKRRARRTLVALVKLALATLIVLM